MASPSEALASHFNWSTFSQATDLKKRLLFTLSILVVYRLGTYIPLPGIDPQALKVLFQQHQGGILGMFNMFSGGALGRMTVFALTIVPYISASIIVQLMTSIVPSMEALRKEGEAGRTKINQYTRFLTVILALLQGYGIAVGLEGLGTVSAVLHPGLYFRLSTAVIIMGGTMSLVWLGEQITKRGIGNGVSLIIFSGIVAGFPVSIAAILEMGRTGALSTPFVLFVFVMGIVFIGGITFMEMAQRRLVVQYPKRQVGKKVFGGQSSHLPLKLNMAGVIPPIFASSLLLMPSTLATFGQNSLPDWLASVTALLGPGQSLYLFLYVSLVVFFAFFYTSVVFNSQETADNLKKNGGFIPGIRPGKTTAVYFDYVLTRLTVVGAIYLAIVSILPLMLRTWYAIPFAFGGTSFLILVNVGMDTVTQVQSHLLAHVYKGQLNKVGLRGKRKR